MAKSTSKTVSVQQKFVDARKALSSAMIERDDEIDLVLTALIAQEHPLLVGPPGTGKSYLLDNLLNWLSGSNKFEILLTKFSTPEEISGPIAVSGLKEDKYRRITTGKLPEAELAFIDEIWKASSAILNTTLRLLNERMFENGDGKFKKTPLLMAVAASNEWPPDNDGSKELGALFDRFLFRKKVNPIATKKGLERLLWSSQEELTPKFSSTITVDEVKQAGKEASKLSWTQEAADAVRKLIAELRQEGINPGDRRLRKSITAASAFAYLSGSDEVLPEHLTILAHVLWDDPTEQPEKTAKIVGKIANPTGFRINELLLQIEDIIARNEPKDAVPKLKEVKNELEKLPEDPRKEMAIETATESLKQQYNKYIGITSIAAV